MTRTKDSKNAQPKQPTSLDRDALLAALSAKAIPVEVPELGTVFIKELDALQQMELTTFRNTLENTSKDNVRFMCHVLGLVLCDEFGKLLFTEDEVELLGKSKLKLLNPLFSQALEVNGMTPKAKEDAEGNSEPESTSGSPTN
jgi:hypothetical protein